MIAPRSFATVAIEATETEFVGDYGLAPDYVVNPEAVTLSVPMTVLHTADDDREIDEVNGMMVLFYRDGVGTFYDVDYVTWGPNPDARAFKNANDTPPAMQQALPSIPKEHSTYRCDTHEPEEAQSGGNGQNGSDETSENLPKSWAIGRSKDERTPGAAPLVDGPCPR